MPWSFCLYFGRFSAISSPGVCAPRSATPICYIGGLKFI
jgi:hypothetical protein